MSCRFEQMSQIAFQQGKGPPRVNCTCEKCTEEIVTMTKKIEAFFVELTGNSSVLNAVQAFGIASTSFETAVMSQGADTREDAASMIRKLEVLRIALGYNKLKKTLLTPPLRDVITINVKGNNSIN